MTTSLNENPGNAEPPVFDPTRLAILIEMEEDGDHSMIKDIAAQFVEDINGVLMRIDGALVAGDFAQVAAGAHTIKGSAATFGLFQVEKIARDLEGAAKDVAKHGAIPAIYESIRTAFAAGRGELEAYFAER